MDFISSRVSSGEPQMSIIFLAFGHVSSVLEDLPGDPEALGSILRSTKEKNLSYSASADSVAFSQQT